LLRTPSIASMFSLSPDTRAESCRAALALPGLPSGLRSRHLALLFHNLVVAGRTADALAVRDEARAEVGRSEEARYSPLALAIYEELGNLGGHLWVASDGRALARSYLDS